MSQIKLSNYNTFIKCLLETFAEEITRKENRLALEEFLLMLREKKEVKS